MAEKSYSWGTQKPEARVAKLKLDAEKIDSDQKALDERRRQNKVDLLEAERVRDRENNERNAEKLSKLLIKALGSANPDAVEAALNDGSLENQLKSVVGGLSTSAKKKSAAAPAHKKTEAKGEAPADA